TPVHAHPVSSVHHDTGGTEDLHGTYLRVRRPHFRVDGEGVRRGEERFRRYPGDTRIAVGGVLERWLRVSEPMSDRIADGQLAGLPDRIEDRLVRALGDAQGLCGEVRALEHRPVLTWIERVRQQHDLRIGRQTVSQPVHHRLETVAGRTSIREDL